MKDILFKQVVQEERDIWAKRTSGSGFCTCKVGWSLPTAAFGGDLG